MKVNLIFLIVKTIYIKVVKTTTQHFVDWHLKGRFLKSFLEAFSPFPEIEFTKEFPPVSSILSDFRIVRQINIHDMREFLSS